MFIAPISYRPKAVFNNFKNQNKSMTFKGLEDDTFVKNTSDNKPNKELVEKAKSIYEKAGIQCKVSPASGLLVLSEYNNKVADILEKSPDGTENDLFKSVIIIEGNADFNGSNVTELGNLKRIGKKANFKSSEITRLGSLEEIGEDAYFGGSKITNLDNLLAIYGWADFRNSQVTNLDNLKYIGEGADFRYSPIKSKDLYDCEIEGEVVMDVDKFII